MKSLKKIVPFLLLLLLLIFGCATPRPVFPYPDFKLIEIGDVLCTTDLKNKVKFDQWLEDLDNYLAEVSIGCATPRPVFPYPDFKLIEIGDVLCTTDLKNKVKFDQWLEDLDNYLAEVSR